MYRNREVRAVLAASCLILSAGCSTPQEDTLAEALTTTQKEFGDAPTSFHRELEAIERAAEGCGSCSTEQADLRSLVQSERLALAARLVPEVPSELVDSMIEQSAKWLELSRSSWNPIEYQYETYRGERTFSVRSDLSRISQARKLDDYVRYWRRAQEQLRPEACADTLMTWLDSSGNPGRVSYSPDFSDVALNACTSRSVGEGALRAREIATGLIDDEISEILRVLKRHSRDLSQFMAVCGSRNGSDLDSCPAPGGPLTMMEQSVSAMAASAAKFVSETPETAGDPAERLLEFAIGVGAIKRVLEAQNRMTRGAQFNASASKVLEGLQRQQRSNLELSRVIRDEKRLRSAAQRDSVRRELCSLFGLDEHC